ncbi:MAG: DNA polymerase/3'-5' exonuclease PolX [Gemmatimonadota bacterium]|nr:DNA polymerase/3'-5' exonuclease PolX [Gemmatimonadota bacterium]
MENVEIAATLNEIADLLEIEGANPFRIRAYRNAARTVANLTRPIPVMVAEGEDLTGLPGVGKDISGYIEELVETGRLTLMDEIAERIPRGLGELVKLDGVGPKKAKRLHEELGIASVAELEAALDAGEVAPLKGFGAKTVERMRRAIAEHREHGERVKLSDADSLIRPLLEHVRRGPGIEEVEVAGSYRRRRETVGDVDLLAVCEEAAPAMEHFTAFDAIARVESAGETRASVILRSGLQVDLRILPRRSYGAALHYFTGSKAHNVAVRKLGVERGLRISEYGVFRVPEGAPEEETGPEEGERIGGATEEEVFDAVGLPWIVPELREDRGEIEAAREGRLPELIEVDDIRGDLQMHSTWSDGKDPIEAMARACRDRGYAYMAITDHSQRVTVAGGLDAARLEEQWEEIDEVRERMEGIEILRGLEVDILRDGSLDLDDAHLDGLDVVVVSVHSYMNLPKAEMTERVIAGISHPAVDVLAHPTGRILNRRHPYEIDVEAVLHAAAERDVAVELNAQPDRLDLNDVQVRRAKELGVKVAIDTDAHSVAGLRYVEYGVEQARRGWLEAGDVLNAMSADELRAWLDRK